MTFDNVQSSSQWWRDRELATLATSCSSGRSTVFADTASQQICECSGRSSIPLGGQSGVNGRPLGWQGTRCGPLRSCTALPLGVLLCGSLYIKQPWLALECSSDAPTRTSFVWLSPYGTMAKASTIHSYHTFFPSVCRQILTSSSLRSGNINGVCGRPVSISLRFTAKSSGGCD